MCTSIKHILQLIIIEVIIMEYFKDLVWLYCSSPGSGRNKEEIISIFETRSVSVYQKSKFEDVLAQMGNILEKCLDCRILAQLLLLLQELLPKAKTEIAALWKATPNRYEKTLKNFFIHADQRSCDMCSLVKSSSAYLERELGSGNKIGRSISSSSGSGTHQSDSEPETKLPLTLNCVACKSTDIKRIVLSCGHALCRNCANNAVKRIADSSNKDNHFICPVDRNLCGLKSLEAKLAEVQGQTVYVPLAEFNAKNSSPSKAVGFNVDPKTKLSCPKCHEGVDQNPNDGLLAECLLCNFCFCSKCRQAFHGNHKMCPAVVVVSAKDVNIRNNTVNFEESKGASAKEYELDFYKNSFQDLFDTSEIQEAFQSLNPGCSLPPAPKWPWENLFSSVEGRKPTPSLQYPHPYSSLQVGHWVEDELLEKVLEIVFQENDVLQNRVAILESFVLNWSLRKKQSQDELPKVLQEKQIFKKTLIFALINTDTRGHGGHWMLAVIFLQKQKIIIFDSSLVLSSEYYQKYFFGLLHILHVAHQFEDRGTIPDFNAGKWRLFVSLDAVQQNNAFDCGPLVVCNAFCLASLGIQLDRVPKSYSVREWLHHTLVTKKNAIGDRLADKESELELGRKGSTPKKPFAPKGLAIRFKFFKNCELI